MTKRYFVLVCLLCLALLCKAETTDISSYDNVIYTENVSSKAGETITLSVKMKNAIAMTGYQFDIELPDGFSVSKTDDFYDIALSTARTTTQKTNYFDSALQSDGTVRVMASSTKNYTFSGNDGEIATVQIAITGSVAAGSYPIKLKNIVMSDANSKTYKVELVESTITITSDSSYLKGDMNDDGVLTIDDVTLLVNEILKKK